MRRVLITIFFVLALLVGTTPLLAAPPEQERYIVVLHETVESPQAVARGIASQVGGQVGYVYEHALKGFSISVPLQAVAALERNPDVQYVENDHIRYAFVQTVPTGIRRIFADTNPNISIDGSDDYRVDVDVQWLDRNTPPDALIAAHDIGAIGYFTRRPILDLAGLISQEVLPFIRDQAKLGEWIRARGAHYLVTFPDWYGQLTASPDLVELFSGNSAVSPQHMTVYAIGR